MLTLNGSHFMDVTITWLWSAHLMCYYPVSIVYLLQTNRGVRSYKFQVPLNLIRLQYNNNVNQNRTKHLKKFFDETEFEP